MADRSLGFNISTSEDLTRAAKEMKLAVDSLRDSVKKLDGMIARVRVEADTKKADAALGETERQVKALDGKTANVKVDIDKRKFTDAANAWALLSRNMKTLALPVGIAAAAPMLLEFGQAAGVASQSLLLLPAAGAAAGAVLGTIKLGTVGLSAAFKDLAKGDLAKFTEALAKLSPEARAFALSVQAIKPAFDAMQLDVQNALFRGFAGTLKDLAGTYLPVLRAGFVGIAGEINAAGLQIAGFVRQSQTVQDVQAIFANTRDAMHELSPAGAAILQILRDIATVGSTFLPGLAAGFTEVAQRAADFVAAARESGKLRDWISQGLSALGLLAQTFINVGSIIASVFKALNSDSDGFLTKIRDMSARLAEFFKSAEGQDKLREVFSALRDLGAALVPLLGAVAGAVLLMVQTLAPALPPLTQGLTDVYNASGPLLGVFGELAVAVLPPLGAALSALAPILGPLLLTITAVAAATKLYATTMALVAVATKAWAVVQVIAALATGELTIAQLAMNVALMANPIGIIVVALVALAAALVFAYNHSETFRAIVQAAWAGIQAAAATAWAVLQGIFSALTTAVSAIGQFFTDLWLNYVVPAWAGITSAVSTAWSVVSGILSGVGTAVTTVGQFFTDLWQAVSTAWAGITEVIRVAAEIILVIILLPFALFFNAVLRPAIEQFAAFWSAVWAGIQAVVATVTGVLIGLWNSLVSFLSGVFGPATTSFRDTVAAAWAAIQSAVNAVCQFLLGLWNTIVGYLRSTFQPTFQVLKDFVLLQWNMIRDGLTIVWNFIRDRLWQPMVNFATTTIPQAFQKIADSARSVWDSVVGFFRNGVNGIIAAVNWMVDQVNKVLSFLHIGTLPRIAGLEAGGTVPAMASGGPMPVKDGFATNGPVAIVGEGNPSRPEYVIPTDPKYRKRAIGLYAELGGQLMAKGGALAARRPYQGGALDVQYMANGGVVGDVVGFLTGGVGGAVDSILSGLTNMLPAGMFRDVAGGIANLVGGGLKSMIQTAWDAYLAALAAAAAAVTGVFTGGGGAVGGGDARAWIIAHESGGNPTARNPTSTASGLYQFINGTWKAYGGSTATAAQASVAEQNAVADRYVASRYGSWENAKAFWISHGWYSRGGILPVNRYDSGGMLPTGVSMAVNNTGYPERVLPRGGDGGALLAAVQGLRAELRALRGDVDHHGDNAALASRIDLTNRLLAGAGGSSAAMAMQGDRTRAELGAW